MTPATFHPAAVPALRQVVRVLSSGGQARRNRGQLWILLVIVAIGALPLLLLLTLAAPGRSSVVLHVVAPTMLMLGVIVVWAMIVFDVLRQNQPQLAQLVPGHVAGLRRALWAGAASCSLLVGGLAVPVGIPVLPALAVMLAICAAVAVVVRWPWANLTVFVVLWGPESMRHEVGQAFEVSWSFAPWAATVVCAVASALVLYAVVLTGGPYHRRAQARIEAFGSIVRNQAQSRSGRAPGLFLWGWQNRLVQWPYASRLRKLSADPQSSVGERLGMGMGAQAHWSVLVVTLVLIAAMVGVVVLVGAAFPMEQKRDTFLTGGLIGVGMAVAMVPIGLAAGMARTRREQRLLRLLPGAPQGAALNRWLAKRFAAFQLLMVLVVMAVLVAVDAFVAEGSSLGVILDVALSALVCTPLLVLALWRDWSRLDDGIGAWQVGSFVAFVSMGAVGYCWVHFAHSQWWGLLPLTALVMAALGPWRWRHAIRSPVAWPAGRF